MSEIRNDWITLKIGEIAKFVGGGTPSKSNSDYWNGNIPWASIKDLKGDSLLKTLDFITEIGLKNSATNIAKKNQLIIATRINPGQPIITRIDTAINQDLKIVIPLIELDLDFLFYFFKNSRKKIQDLSSGTTVLGINLNNLNSINIKLPPLPIQRAIVSRIEELFSSLDQGIADLKKAQEQLKVYRQAVLKKAFEGDWEKEILSAITEVKDGTHDTPKYVEVGIPFVTQKNIKENGLFFESAKYISLEEHEKFYKRSNVTKEDILISMIGANRGMACIVNTNEVFSIKNVGLIKSNPEQISNLFLLYYFKSDYAREFIKSKSKGGAQEFVGLTELRNFPIPNVPLSRQKQIVKEIESRISVCDEVEQTIAESLQKSEALRQSILKKAFEGKLLSPDEIKKCEQEPDYEPADVLLERIKKDKNKKSK